MNVDKITIAELIYKTRLIVPSYQRGFDWKKSQIEEFWEDLFNQYSINIKKKNQTSEGSDLFLGTVILHKKEKNELEIVDGQQRITSIFILLIAIRKKIDEWLNEKIEVKDYSLLNVKHELKDHISLKTRTRGAFIQSKLQASIRIANTINYMSSAEWDGQFLNKYNDQNTKKEIIIVQPIYSFLLNKLQNIEPKYIDIFIETLLDTDIIKIEINNIDEAFTLFERTNARGKDLEVSDLLKNHLFMNWNQNNLMHLENEWELITVNSRNQFIRMLKYFYVSQKGYITQSKLYKGLKDVAKGNVEKLLEDIKNFSIFYSTFTECSKDKIHDYLKEIFKNSNGYSVDILGLESIRKSMVSLNYFRISQCLPLIYSFLNSFRILNLSEETKCKLVPIKFFQNLENYHFVNNFILDRVGNEIEKLYADCSEKFNNSKSQKEFILNYNYLFKSLKEKIASRQEFEPRFKELNYKDDKRLDFMYIFDKINNTNNENIRSPAYNFFDPKDPGLRKEYDIEHWYPQKPPEQKDYMKDESLHNIGNLLVIPHKTNIRLQNFSSKKKAEQLNNDKEFHSMPHIKEFLNEYKDEIEDWDENSIKKRSQKLANDAYSIYWHFNPNPIKI